MSIFEPFIFFYQDNHIVRICFALALMQTLLCLSNHVEDVPDRSSLNSSVDKKEEEAVCKLLADLLGAGAASAVAHGSDLASLVKTRLMPFLRSACLFYHGYTDVPLPTNEAFSDLCQYLGLPESIDVFINEPGTKSLLYRYAVFTAKMPSSNKIFDIPIK
jgi:hypothetical protein